MKEKMIKLVVLSVLLLKGITISTNVCHAEEDFINNFELLYEDKNDYDEGLNGGVPKIILTDTILNDEDIVETTIDEITTQSSSEKLTTNTRKKKT